MTDPADETNRLVDAVYAIGDRYIAAYQDRKESPYPLAGVLIPLQRDAAELMNDLALWAEPLADTVPAARRLVLYLDTWLQMIAAFIDLERSFDNWTGDPAEPFRRRAALSREWQPRVASGGRLD